MRTVGLIVYPDRRIFTVGEMSEPSEPMHSGYTHEEEEIMQSYRRKIAAYREAVENAQECQQDVAEEILNTQHPGWENKIIDKNNPAHFDVKNILVRELIGGKREFFTVDEDKEIECVNAKPLPGNEVYPKLEEEGKRYPLVSIALDSEGNQHLNVGLVSNHNYISSYETGEHLPDGDTIHWCHPTRFRKVPKK